MLVIFHCFFCNRHEVSRIRIRPKYYLSVAFSGRLTSYRSLPSARTSRRWPGEGGVVGGLKGPVFGVN